MKKILEKLNKLSLSATIIIASLILGGFIFVTQVIRQESIERQQEIKLQEDRQIEKAKAEQIKKEYVAKRKNECYDTYLQEKKNWNNVVDFMYSEARDICIVKYKSSEPAKTKEECEGIVKDISGTTDDNLREWLFNRYSNCLENWFSKEF